MRKGCLSAPGAGALSSDQGPRPGDEYSSPDRERGARLLMVESGAGAVAATVGQRFTAAFAIHLGASAFQIGILVAAINLMMVVTQLSAVRLIKPLGGRKRALVTAALVGALPFLFLALVPFVPSPARVWALVVLGALAVSLTFIGLPAWGSLVAELVPRGRRGRFLGLKGTIGNGVTLAVGLLGALLLDGLGQRVAWGFVALFVVAMAARMLSFAVLYRLVDPRPMLEIDTGGAPWSRLWNLRNTMVGRFNAFILVFHLCVGISMPFVAIHILRNLEVSYFLFISMGVASSMTTMAASPLWGRLADFRSTKLVLAASVILVALHPMLWLVSGQIWYLFAAFGTMGIASAGWNLALYKFALENASDEQQPVAVGTMVAIVAAGMFGGALIGGGIAAYLPTVFSYQLLTLFPLSSLLALTAVAVLLPGALGKRGLADMAESLLRRGAARSAALRHSVAIALQAQIHRLL